MCYDLRLYKYTHIWRGGNRWTCCSRRRWREASLTTWCADFICHGDRYLITFLIFCIVLPLPRAATDIIKIVHAWGGCRFDSTVTCPNNIPCLRVEVEIDNVWYEMGYKYGTKKEHKMCHLPFSSSRLLLVHKSVLFEWKELDSERKSGLDGNIITMRDKYQASK